MNDVMKNTSDTRVTSFLRICLGLLFVPATVFLLVFCFCTGRPCPPTLVPWEQLGFRYWMGLDDILKDRAPRFCCFSACGNYYVTVTPCKFNQIGEVLDLQVFDLATRQPFCLIEGLADAPSTFRVSPDKQLVQVELTDTLTVYCWPQDGCNTLIKHKEYRVAIGGVYNSKGGVSLGMLMSNDALSLKNRLPEVLALTTFAIYFDRQIPLKALVHGAGVLELWDLSSQRRDWQISRFFFIEPIMILPDKERFITLSCFREIEVRSLKDGRNLRTYSQEGVVRELRSTPDGRFLFISSSCEHDLIRVARHLSNRLADWLVLNCSGMYDSYDSVLLDMQTGKSWPYMDEGSPRAAFAVTHGNRPKLIRVSVDGWFEWDIPPRWRWISPWAWYALLHWLILVAAWRGLRRSQPAIEKEPSTKKSLVAAE